MARCVVLAVNDPNILYLLRRYVEESGLQAIVAAGDGDLVAAVLRTCPALIVADAAGGRAAGKALRTLREGPETRQIPVLLYGSEASHSVGEDAPLGPQVAAGYLQDYLMYD